MAKLHLGAGLVSQMEAVVIENRTLHGNGEPQWFVVYARPRHEKRVAEQLNQRCIESFLPLYRTVRRWKDRRKLVYLPLFAGYLFVHIPIKERLEVLQLHGVVRFVEFDGTPVQVQENEIHTLQRGLMNNLCLEPHPYLKVGGRVRVRSGPLAGAEGILLRKKGALRLVLSFDAILRSVAVEVDAWSVEAINV